MPSPRETYAARHAEREAAARRHDRRDAWLGNARLAVFVVGGGLAWACWRFAWSYWLLAAPAALFLALIIVHAAARRARDRARRAVDYYARGLARIDEKWRGHGDPGDRFADPHHLYAADLDLFGAGSVYELLCHAGTVAGRETLAAWLKAPADVAAVRGRQAAARDLAERLDLREDLALRADDVGTELQPERLRAWVAAPAALRRGWRRALALATSTLSGAALIGWAVGLGPRPLVVMIVVVLVVNRLTKTAVAKVVGPIEARARNLDALAHVLARVERERFTAPRLEEQRAALGAGGRPASAQIERLGRLVALLDSGRNQLVAIFAGLVLWDLHCAYALEAWRLGAGAHIGRWLEGLGEIEALALLGAYAYEHPDDQFPELTEVAPRFAAEGLGHPLLPAATCVRNDVALDAQPRVLIVSGSNMSGKSTLLRSVGVATVLGLTGAPVRARRLTLSPLGVGATLRIQDSLGEGVSRFYAEIVRLREIVERAKGAPPLLFLIDEMLGGTNSHDRRIGAEAVIVSLAERGAIGLVTTHDLALADITASLGARAANVHFEDQLDGGRIAFDYTMRPG
ncbi:MAG TPA: DNA mismatch repair protein MutS, partial [Polyangia bacterium]